MELGNLKNKVGNEREIKLLKGRLASEIGSRGRKSWTLGERAETTLGDLFKEQGSRRLISKTKTNKDNKDDRGC